MFMRSLKTLLTEATKRTFDSDYVEPKFRNVHVSIEFPIDRQHYPGIWVSFDPVGELEPVGVGHIEYAEGSEAGSTRRFTRWYYQGTASFTVVGLSSLERDWMFDEMVRVLAFGSESTATSEFRAYIEDNEFLAVNFDFDAIGMSGFSETPGTPWGSDEVIYEATVVMECFGEFVSDGFTSTLVPLSAIETYPYADNEPDPLPPPVGMTDAQAGWQ